MLYDLDALYFLILHFYVFILLVLGFNTESKETFQCPLLACHAKIALQLIVHQLLLFNIEMLIYLENIVSLNHVLY